MNKGSAKNIFAILAVVAVVGGAAWFKSQRVTESVSAAEEEASGRIAADGTQAEPPAVAPEPEANEAGVPAKPEAGEEKPTALVKLPRLVDLGANKCKACKALAPILDALREEYKGRLNVEFIDVWKNPDAKVPYKIRLIPTQILYNAAGEEVWRHEGFISKEDLKAVFAERGGVK